MNREKLDDSLDFGDTVSALGITASRQVELNEYLNNLTWFQEEGTVSQTLINLWNDDTFTPKEVLYITFKIGMEEGLSRMQEHLMNKMLRSVLVIDQSQSPEEEEEDIDSIFSDSIIQ